MGQAITRRYLVPVNPTDDGESQTVDIVTLTGTTKQRRKGWRVYLKKKYNITNASHVARALGFKDLQ